MTTSDDRELIHQLLDDVSIIEAHFPLGGIPTPSLLRTCFAPILRRWIAEGVFFRAQKLILPTHVTFATTSNTRAMEQCGAGVYEHWMELMFFGTIGVSVSRKTAQHVHDVPERPDAAALEPTPKKAKKFFEQPMFFWKSDFYTREDVIKWHANKLGGVHLDFRRKEDEAHINEIKTHFGFELKGGLRAMLMGEEIERGRADRARRQSVYDATELIAMDTARIFASGIRGSEKAFLAVLE